MIYKYNLKTGIQVFRNGGSLGLAVERDDHSEIVVSSGAGGCFHVLHVSADGAVAAEGSIEAGDKIVECNGASVGTWSMEEFVGRVRVAEDPIVFSVLKCGGLHGSLTAAAAEIGRRMDASKTTGEDDGDDLTSVSGSETVVAERFESEISGSKPDNGNLPEAKPTRVGRLKKMFLRQRAPQSENDIDRTEEEMQLMESFEIRIKTNGGQLGAMLSMNKDDGSWFVKGIIDGSPVALDGNMKEGDRVERVNGRSITGLPMDDIRPMLRSRGVIVFHVSRPLHEVSLTPEDIDGSEFVKEIEGLKKQVRTLKDEIRSKDSEIEHLRIALENAWRTNKHRVPSRQPETVQTRKDQKPKLWNTASLREREAPLDDRNDTSLIPREEEGFREVEFRDDAVSQEQHCVSPIDVIDPSISRRWIDSSVE